MRHFFARREHGRLHQFAFLAAGGLAGAGVALLLAPRTGREARKSLVHLGKFARDGAKNFKSELNSRMDRFFGDIQHDLKSCLDDGKSWTEEKRKQLERTFKSGKKHIAKEVSDFCMLN